jgi:UDP-glucose 4-epimerase
MKEAKTVLVTGIAGFIGSNLLDRLMENGHLVIGVDNLSKGSLDNIAHHLEDDRFTFLEEDISRQATLQNIQADVDVIVHLAAYKIPRYGNTIDTLKINSKGAENVLNFARRQQCKCIMASTSDVYGMSKELPFREDTNCTLGSSTVPRWSYAVSKLFDEHMAFAYQEAFGFPVTILRFFGSYGPRQHRSWWGGPQSVFIDAVFNDETIPIHGDGQQTRTFTYISDTVDGIYAAVTRPEANGEIFNIGAEHEITILELAERIKKLSGTGGDLKVEFIPYEDLSDQKYEDVRRRVPDTSLAEQLLEVKAQVELDEGLRRTIRWHCEHYEIEAEKWMSEL